VSVREIGLGARPTLQSLRPVQWGIALAAVAGEAWYASVEAAVVGLARASLLLARSKATNQVM